MSRRIPTIDCVECGKKAIRMRGKHLFGSKHKAANKSFYVCSCGARVTANRYGKAMGSTATKELRELRIQLHEEFDVLWLQTSKRKKFKTRNDAYKWLAAAMDKSERQCHFGKFTVDECNQALKLIKNFKTNA